MLGREGAGAGPGEGEGAALAIDGEKGGWEGDGDAKRSGAFSSTTLRERVEAAATDRVD